MKRKTSKTVKIQKSLKKAGYKIEVKKEDGNKWYKIITPEQATALEVIKRKEEPVVIVLGKKEESICYCQKVCLAVEEGKAVAICKKEMSFKVIGEIKIRE